MVVGTAVESRGLELVRERDTVVEMRMDKGRPLDCSLRKGELQHLVRKDALMVGILDVVVMVVVAGNLAVRVSGTDRGLGVVEKEVVGSGVEGS